MAQAFPEQLNRFFNANEPHVKLRDFDFYKSPWVSFNQFLYGSAPRAATLLYRLIDIIKANQWEAGEYGDANTFADAEESKIQTCEIYTIKDWSQYSRANNHQTTEIFDEIGCDFVDAFKNNIPMLQDLMHQLPFEKFLRIHVNILKPGGYLLPHMDVHPGEYTKGLGHKIMIPLNLPQGFKFKVWGAGQVPLEIGKPVAVNTGKYLHAVINDSDQDRYMLHVKGLPGNTEQYRRFLENQNAYSKV